MGDVGGGSDDEEEGRGIGSERGWLDWRDAAERRSGRLSPTFRGRKRTECDRNSDRN